MCLARQRSRLRYGVRWTGGDGIMTALKPFAMPKWGIEMSEGTVAEWRVQEGKPFVRGDVIALIETDKITNEVEAEADGCLVRLLAAEQQAYPVGALLGVLGSPDASTAEIDAFVASYMSAGQANSSESGEAGEVPAFSGNTQEDRPLKAIPGDIAISPAAWRTAQSARVDVKDVEPTGRNGRITRQDVDKALAGARMPVLKGPIEVSGQESAFASPMARRLAVLKGIDLGIVIGTARGGRISKADVLACIAASAPAPEPIVSDTPEVRPAPTDDVEIVPMTAMRKTIARRLTQAKQTIPHIYLRRRVRADRLLNLRDRLGKQGTINDYLIRACALALREVPAVNVQVHGDTIHRFAHADIAFAVATDKGLITPIVKHADEMDVVEIAKEASNLAQRARAGKLTTEEFQGGSFSISNLGNFGVEEFDAVINPPQGAILAVGAARDEPIVDDGTIRLVPHFHFSLSCDHRAIDGVDGARFLEALANLIEEPDLLFSAVRNAT